MVAMKPFHVPFNEFHAHTKPKDWLEGLHWPTSAMVSRPTSIEVAAFVDPNTRALVHQVLADEGHADFGTKGARGHRSRSAGGR